MMKSSSNAFLAMPLLAAMLLVLAPRDVGAVTCMATELAPCLPAMMGPEPPTDTCCAKLKEQQPCLCGYMKDPAFKKYLDNPNAKKVAEHCKIPYPFPC